MGAHGGSQAAAEWIRAGILITVMMPNTNGDMASLRIIKESNMKSEKEFFLYDLKVEVVLDGRSAVCRHIEGQPFAVQGENLVFQEAQQISMYALAALLPLLPAKQRELDPHDWMTTDMEVACPDPHCGGRFRITRLGKRRFTNAETTGLPQVRNTPYWQKD